MWVVGLYVTEGGRGMMRALIPHTWENSGHDKEYERHDGGR